MRCALKNLSLSALLLGVALLLCEIGIRSLGSYDPDGNFSVFSNHLRPYRLPVKAIEEKISRSFSSSTIVTYDPVLGWAPRPHSKSHNDLYHYNSLGIRSAPTEYALPAPANAVRIALFGDSFTHGDEVPFEQTWGYKLEDSLNKKGLRAEVINFGVPGYGMDQAFLRWRALGHKFAPDVVIFGLHMENVKRNVNLIRPVYLRKTGLPFSKPRFLLNNDGLELINTPPIPPDKLPELLNNIPGWRLGRYEYFIDPDDYRTSIWHLSKTYSLFLGSLYAVSRSLRKGERLFYDLSGEPARLAVKILQEFKQSVESDAKKFLIVHLPNRGHLQRVWRGKELTYSQLLAKIEESNTIIHLESDMLEELKGSPLDILFQEQGHYSAKGNEVVAQAIVKHIVSNERGAPAFLSSKR